MHHTTYVKVYDSGPDWLTVGYTTVYLRLMIAIFDDQHFRAQGGVGVQIRTRSGRAPGTGG